MRHFIKAGDKKWFVDVYLDELKFTTVKYLFEHKDELIAMTNYELYRNEKKQVKVNDLFIKNGHVVLRYKTNSCPITGLVQHLRILCTEKAVNDFYKKNEDIFELCYNYHTV